MAVLGYYDNGVRLSKDDVEEKPLFLQPAYPDLGSSMGRQSQRPPRLPGGGELGRCSPDFSPPLPTAPKPLDGPSMRSPLSSRASSPRRRITPASPTSGTPRGSSRAASSTGVPSSAGSSGHGLSGVGSFTGTGSRPGTAASLNEGSLCDLLDNQSLGGQEMMQMGYLPVEEYGGIMALNKELREQNKRLRAELINIQVENQKLRMEESFLRESASKAGFELPEEVPHVELLRPCTPQC
mmetsp:Transcript_49474/g.78287  ORF Transcript_49474/g.78287 Transcript_49474/m.78287 type:complete len:239 (+) Transcript_49474:61-777(+)|eukprot:CAMPEP_0169077250 /NCGR_PEP_ID=MMETSP1015-20121227/8777_1 /TAXON_ID=342587 /ORGANISM="Karlodinium micrum, Strain CCMP2283" /LENGTH=238 /DNA_ID=CAMNT_0009136759 /DNA_START=61 /DNA_END=777 /DNA_ORIENTATION=-